MAGDITRRTHKQEKHYKGVLKQQARVDLDADWNEQVDITTHRIEAETKDTIGACGTPIDGNGNAHGFELTVDASATNILIGKGRYYVDGLLCENEADVLYAEQQDLKNAPTIEDGLNLAYLDVWERDITAFEDESIREKALGGPDTATRVKTVWQVKLKKLDNDTFNCSTAPLPFDDSTGQLSARAQPEEDPANDCQVPPGAGYRRLENQLYRVEIHKSGDASGDITKSATFKWSRENASVVMAVDESATGGGFSIDGDPHKVKVSSLGRDDVLGLHKNDWVEVLDDATELSSEPGTLAQITNDPSDNILILSEIINGYESTYHPKVRRWESGAVKVEIPVTNNGFIQLEDGIQIKFESGQYNTGDYWLIPARTITADIEWPKDSAGEPKPQPKQGIKHHYCKLGLVKSTASKLDITDCRTQFPPLTDLMCLYYVSGDGQEGAPGKQLPFDLVVGVSNGNHAVKDARVRFKTDSGGGSLLVTQPIKTNAQGLASCRWKLGDAEFQTVTAELLDSNDQPFHLPVIFTAHVSLRLSYISGDGQEGLPGETLPAALRVLVEDSLGKPLEDRNVTFRIVPKGKLGAQTSGDLLNSNPSGTFETTTDANGIATCNWQLGPEVGLNLVRATLDAPQFAQPAYNASSLSFNEILFNARGVKPAGGGLCTITIGDGTKSFGQLTVGIDGTADHCLKMAVEQVNKGEGGTICILRGNYEITQPVIADHCQNLVIHGNRLETILIAEQGNQALVFEWCIGVELYDLKIFVKSPVLNPVNQEGLVTFKNCYGIVVQGCLISGAGDSSPRNLSDPTSYCLSIINATKFVDYTNPLNSPSSGTATALVRDCHIVAGASSLGGILLHDTREARIEGNLIEMPVVGGGYGIDLGGGDIGSDWCVLAENIINGFVSGIEGALGGIHIGNNCDFNTINDNQIIGGLGFGIGLGDVDKDGNTLGGASGLTIGKNLIRGMAQGGIGVHSLPKELADKNNPIKLARTNELQIRSNRIEGCAYIPNNGPTYQGIPFAGAISLWEGERMQITENEVIDYGHYSVDENTEFFAPFPVSGIFIVFPQSELLLSHNCIISDLPYDAIHSGSFRLGILLYQLLPSRGFSNPAAIISDNKVISASGPALLCLPTGGKTTLEVNNNHFAGTVVKAYSDYVKNITNFPNTVINLKLESQTLQFSGNTIISTIEFTVDYAIWINASHVTFTANHFKCYFVSVKIGRREITYFPSIAHVQLEVDSASATGNHCLESRVHPDTHPRPVSLKLITKSNPPCLTAVANVTTNGVVLDPSNGNFDLANLVEIKI